MKKLIIISIIIILTIVGLCGCNEQSKPDVRLTSNVDIVKSDYKAQLP